jgi:hypothetical protein
MPEAKTGLRKQARHLFQGFGRKDPKLIRETV